MGEERVAGGDDLRARLRVLPQLRRALGTTMDLQRVVAVTAGMVRPVLPFERVQLWMRDGTGLQLAAAEPEVPDDLRGARVPGDGSLVGLAVSQHAAILTHDVASDARFADGPATLASLLGGSSALAAPLVPGPEVTGVLVATAADPNGFTETDLALWEAVAIQVADAVESGQRFAQVMELERLKADFISRVSHELRTPITIISGFLDTLVAHDDSIDRDARLHMLERTQAATNRLGDLIADLLTLSRVETELLRPNVEAVELHEFVVRVCEPLADQVQIDVPPDARLDTDPELLERALWAVVDNAVKYGREARVGAHHEHDGGDWVIVIEDRGPGFADDVRDVAFEVFTRSAETTHIPGLGLGLALARTVIEALGGSISVEDRNGDSGATVAVRVPAKA